MSETYRRAGKPDWVKNTPREDYFRGTRDAATYIAFGRIPELPMSDGMRKADRAFFGGMVARLYGVNLMPPGRCLKAEAK